MNFDSSKQLLTCFKYRSGKRALECLQKGTLYFAKPHELNDTLEAKYDHASPEDFTRVKAQTYSEISQKRGGPVFDFDQEAIADMAAINARENTRLKDSTDQIGIFSAARRPDHQAMWTYYADEGKGVCFELAWTHDIFNQYQLWATDVVYQSKARTHNRADDWRKVFLALAAKYPSASLEDLYQLSLEEDVRRKWGIDTVSRAASIKHTDWAHEQEIRLLVPKSGALPMLADVLKRVHYVRSDGEYWGEIMQLLQARYPSVETVHWQFNHGTISSKGTEMEFRLVPI